MYKQCIYEVNTLFLKFKCFKIKETNRYFKLYSFFGLVIFTMSYLHFQNKI